MSDLLSNVWIEIKGSNQKILICLMYREFNDLTINGKLSQNQQLERLKIFALQMKQATNEGLVLSVGDWKIDLQKLKILHIISKT